MMPDDSGEENVSSPAETPAYVNSRRQKFSVPMNTQTPYNSNPVMVKMYIEQ